MYLLKTVQIDHTNEKLIYPWKYNINDSETLKKIFQNYMYHLNNMVFQ